MHDIQSHTAAAIPQLLRELKERNYKVVHVVYGRATEAAAHPQQPGRNLRAADGLTEGFQIGKARLFRTRNGFQ
jgi:hypothetical protein